MVSDSASQSNGPAAGVLIELDLFQALGHTWLKLPLAAVREVGVASQTLAAILGLTKKETFASVKKIAEGAHLPLKTVRKHLVILQRDGWIANEGRSHTKAGRPRRTVTLKITQKTTDALTEYVPLPWFFACAKAWWKTTSHYGGRNRSRVLDKRLHMRSERLSWGARAVLAVVLAKLMALKSAADKIEGFDGDYWRAVDDVFGGLDRFQFSLSRLEQATGLSRETLVSAKRQLKKLNVVDWYYTPNPKGDKSADKLAPNRRFRVKLRRTVLSPGRYTDFLEGFGAQDG